MSFYTFVNKLSGKVLTSDKVITQILKRKVLDQDTEFDNDRYVATEVIQLLMQDNNNPFIEALFILNPDLLKSLAGLVYAGMKIKEILIQNNLEINVTSSIPDGDSTC